MMAQPRDGGIERIEDSLEEIFSEGTPVANASREEFAKLVAEIDSLARGGFPYPGYFLEEIEEFMSGLGEAKLAK